MEQPGKFSKFDISIMERALALARRSSGFVLPNPMVGAVVVNQGHIVGMGYHRRAGANHAEIEALLQAKSGSSGDLARGGTLYLTLEPCNHHGRTPPCTEAVIESGVARVVIAMQDPNPRVKGGGIERLRAAGIEVEVGLLSDRAHELNLTWLHWIKTGEPFVTLKLAVSLDGMIGYAPEKFEEGGVLRHVRPRWISSLVAREQVQRLRRHVDAVMVGVGTVLADNPQLTNRTGVGRQPLRVVIDSELKSAAGANIFRARRLGEEGPTPSALVFTTTKSNFQKRKELELAGVEVCVLEGKDGQVDLRAAFRTLGERGIQGVMCEGGGKLATTLIREKLCHRILFYQAPLVIGENGVPFVQTNDPLLLKNSYQLEWARRVGPDALMMYSRR